MTTLLEIVGHFVATFLGQTAGLGSDKMQLMQLGIFLAVMTALVVCGCIFTRKPKKTPSDPQQQSGATH